MFLYTPRQSKLCQSLNCNLEKLNATVMKESTNAKEGMWGFRLFNMHTHGKICSLRKPNLTLIHRKKGAWHVSMKVKTNQTYNKIQPAVWYLKVIADGYTCGGGCANLKSSNIEHVLTGERAPSQCSKPWLLSLLVSSSMIQTLDQEDSFIG